MRTHGTSRGTSDTPTIIEPDSIHGTMFGEFRAVASKTCSYVIHDPASMISLGGSAARHKDFAVDSAGSGAIEYLPNERAVRLTVGGDAGARMSYRQNLYNPYNPGCQQRITWTSKFGAAGTNLETRIGYFDDNDGVLVRRTLAGDNLIVRSSTSGSMVETPHALPAGLDLSKDNIFASAFEWLGAGDVQLFANNTLAKRVIQAGTLSSPFMRRPNLPFSVEIKNVGAGASGAITFYCAKVASEGADVFDETNSSLAVTTSTNITTTGLMLAQIRPKSTITLGSITAQDNRALYLPTSVTVSTASAAMTVGVYLNGTVTGSPSWAATEDAGIERDVDGTFDGSSGRLVGFGSIDAAIGTVTIDLTKEFGFPGRALSLGAFTGQDALQVVGFARAAPVNPAVTIVRWTRIG